MIESVRVKVSGEFACWTRPENKVERMSYECMTPSAARNILDAICWRPEMRWVITSIGILKPIRFQALRRNEVQSKISLPSVKKWMQDPTTFEPYSAGAGSSDVTQRNTLALREVAYIIEAYPHVFTPTVENHPTKYMAMFNRRVERGQCFHRPALGCREFAADFEPAAATDNALDDLNIDMGRMLYDIIFRPGLNRPVFFQAEVRKGVLDTRPEQAIPDLSLREEVLACSSKH
jgi:CRISPR-associated protein Cas5d